jgi:hypothetical protein
VDEATSSRRVDIEGKTGKKERGCETIFIELLGDGVDKAVDIVEGATHVQCRGACKTVRRCEVKDAVQCEGERWCEGVRWRDGMTA